MTFLDVPVKIKNNLEKRMCEIFSMYDFIGNFMVENGNVPNILRFLGCAPTHKDITDFIKLCEFPDVPGSIHLSKFLNVLTAWLLEGRMKPATLDELVDAFATLDQYGKAYLTKEEFSGFMKDYGDALTEEQEHTMMVNAIVLHDQICDCEQYIYKLLSEPTDSIYAQAMEINSAQN